MPPQREACGVRPTSTASLTVGGTGAAASCSTRATRRARSRRVALVEQEAAATVPLTVSEAVLVGRTPHASRWGGMTADDDAAVATAIAEAGVADLADRSLA